MRQEGFFRYIKRECKTLLNQYSLARDLLRFMLLVLYWQTKPFLLHTLPDFWTPRTKSFIQIWKEEFLLHQKTYKSATTTVSEDLFFYLKGVTLERISTTQKNVCRCINHMHEVSASEQWQTSWNANTLPMNLFSLTPCPCHWEVRCVGPWHSSRGKSVGPFLGCLLH